jgi:hypothetical protein
MLAVLACGGTPAAFGQNVAPGMARVGPAVVLVGEPTTGTAFAIRVENGRTLLLTAAHVVGCGPGGTGCAATATVYVGGDRGHAHRARVLAHGDVDRDDLALLALDDVRLPVVSLATADPPRDTPIAVLGYPEAAVSTAQSSAFSEASVDAVLSLGSTTSAAGAPWVTFAGDSYQGDSGGPVFGRHDGTVVGVVHGQSHATLQFEAASPAVLQAFLRANAAAIDAFVRQPATATTTATSGVRASAASVADCDLPVQNDVRADCYARFADAGNAHAAFLAAREYLLPARGYASIGPSGAASPAAYTDVALGQRYLRMAADAHDFDAELELGSRYAGVAPFPPDPAALQYWLQRAWDDAGSAAARGDMHAAFVRASMLSFSTLRTITSSSVDGNRAMIACANRGGGECAKKLGDDARFGSAKDVAQAIQWYRKGARAGDRACMIAMGSLYEDGEGVPKDRAMAAAWYRAALPAREARSRLFFLGYRGTDLRPGPLPQ